LGGLSATQVHARPAELFCLDDTVVVVGLRQDVQRPVTPKGLYVGSHEALALFQRLGALLWLALRLAGDVVALQATAAPSREFKA
jgi:hypothetical protein